MAIFVHSASMASSTASALAKRSDSFFAIMMAKKLSERFASADAVLEAIDALWTKIAIATAQMSSR